MEGKRKRDGERWDIIRSARPTVDSTEIYWLLFLVRAKGGAELVGGYKTGQLSAGKGGRAASNS